MTTNRSGGAAVAAALGRSGGGPWPESLVVSSHVDVSRLASPNKMDRVDGRDRDRDRDGARGRDRDRYD